MLEARYMSEEDLFNALGEFSMQILETMGDDELTPEQRGKWLAHEVERLTTEIWESSPRTGEMRFSLN